MRVFLDHCIPAGLSEHLVGHAVTTARAASWEDKQDPDLLRLLDQVCDVLVTVDRNLPFQNNLSKV
jgi:predicted nuclease of predicted toxin-antitoxin system